MGKGKTALLLIIQLKIKAKTYGRWNDLVLMKTEETD